MNAVEKKPLVAWYGDDFTGSAAVLEALAFAGVSSVLFLDIPTEAQLARFPDMRGIGIASIARSKGPDWMAQHLPPAFDWLKARQAPVTHYKVCSTLDSAPHVGSIGKAIDIAAARFETPWIPCLIASPANRRYQLFGHLFASAPGGVFRLDRHPVMARHPVTPMDESDVAKHLARQTERPIGLIDIEALEGDGADAALRRQIENGAEVITLDSLSEAHLARAGRLIWEHRGEGIFAVGSQGLDYALVAHWREAGLLEAIETTAGAGPVERLLVVSGSVSPVTALQIDWAEANSFEVITLDVARVVAGEEAAEQAAFEAACSALAAGRDPMVLTARGPDDPMIGVMRDAARNMGVPEEVANARIGEALGRLLRRLLKSTGLRRAAISGGDTSGHVSKKLDLFAFTALAPTIPGAALLTAHAEDPAVDGLQLALKGGQMGSPDFFGWIKQGGGTR
ncbi:MAG: four-carbon acid sugar kinase family protein [Alphaproteobacteria bacterium]